MKRKIIQNLKVLIAGTMFAMILGEILLHVFPISLTEYNSDFIYSTDPDLGYIPAPNQRSNYNRECFRNAGIRINSKGFRGPEWIADERPAIAILGDSYMLGLQLPEENLTADLLRKYASAQVFNTGVSGFGTYHQYLTWKKFLVPQKPDVVMLFLFLRNDVRDNHCGLASASDKQYSPCCVMENGLVTAKNDFVVGKSSIGVSGWLKRNCLMCRLFKKGRKDPTKPQYPKGNPFADEKFAYQIYRPHAEGKWQEAWDITDTVLVRLKNEVEQSGSKFIVMLIPDVIQTDPDWRNSLEKEIGTNKFPDDFDINYPQEMFSAFADSNNISWINLQSAFNEYRISHKLRAPHFSFCCDGHWNPIGHFIAANMGMDEIIRRGWLTKDARSFPKPWKQLSPKEILGQEKLNEIYSCEN